MVRLEGNILDTVDKIDPTEVDELADDPTYTWGWLKTFESSDAVDLKPQHIAIFEKGELVAFAPCFRQGSSIFDDVREELLLRWQQGVLDGLHRRGFPYLRLNPCLASGAPEGFSSRILVAPHLKAERDTIFEMIVRSLGEQAEKEGVPVYGFLGIGESDNGLSRYLSRNGFSSCLRTAVGILDVPWRSWEEYLGALSRKGRKSIKYQERIFQRHGFTSRIVEDFTRYADLLSALAGNVYRRHSNRPNPFQPKLFRDISRNMGVGSKIFLAEREGRISGFCMALEHRGRMICHHYGTDYSKESRMGQMYFNIGYLAPIRYAISRGIRSVAFGPGEWRIKSRRGCRFERIRIHLSTSDRIGSLALKILLRYLDKKKEGWIRERLSFTQSRSG